MRPIALPAEAEAREEINLTPLLDVVFIMLIFFIVTATFLRETGLATFLSEGESATAGEPETIVVVIDADDGFWIDRRRVEPIALRSTLSLAHATNPGFPVIIRPAHDSSAQALVTVLDRARAAGIENVAVSDGTSAAPGIP